MVVDVIMFRHSRDEKKERFDVQIRLEYLIETLNVADSLQRKI